MIITRGMREKWAMKTGKTIITVILFLNIVAAFITLIKINIPAFIAYFSLIPLVIIIAETIIIIMMLIIITIISIIVNFVFFIIFFIFVIDKIIATSVMIILIVSVIVKKINLDVRLYRISLIINLFDLKFWMVRYACKV